MQRWEYRLFASTDAPAEGFFTPAGRAGLEAALNALGQEGWEVVSADFADEVLLSFRFSALLKRPLPE